MASTGNGWKLERLMGVVVHLCDPPVPEASLSGQHTASKERGQGGEQRKTSTPGEGVLVPEGDLMYTQVS